MGKGERKSISGDKSGTSNLESIRRYQTALAKDSTDIVTWYYTVEPFV